VTTAPEFKSKLLRLHLAFVLAVPLGLPHGLDDV
jgi:hypothetical protein